MKKLFSRTCVYTLRKGERYIQVSVVCVSFGFGFVEFWLGSAMFLKGLDDFSWCRGAAPRKFVENNFWMKMFFMIYRRSHQSCSLMKIVLRSFAKFKGKPVCQSLFLNKKTFKNVFIKRATLAQVFSCEFYEISKNNFFTEHLRTTSSGYIYKTKTQYFTQSKFWIHDNILSKTG